MSERSESNGAGGTPVELATAFLKGFAELDVNLAGASGTDTFTLRNFVPT
jgi:hypothetical protein